MTEPGEAPKILHVLETCLYIKDIDRAERFYTGVLGLRWVGKEEERHVFFRVGPGVLLLFRAEATRITETVPAHGTTGPGHVCLRIPSGSYEAWKRRLAEAGIAIEQEVTWPRGRSFYFRDPDGNSLELAEEDIWPPEAP
ncbi:MAG: VOC family protein [candidate division NC10 bacterium]|nr:VOC family protein [candidate division NC10 bacterium]